LNTRFLFATLVIGSALVAAPHAQAQRSRGSAGPATDFVFDGAFRLDPPDTSYWEPPPGGLLEDGLYQYREYPDLRLSMATEFSSTPLSTPQWPQTTSPLVVSNRATLRFPHPQSPLIEFVVTLSVTMAGAAAPPPTVAAEALQFLNTLEALPVGPSPDSIIGLATSRADAIAIGHGALWVTDYDANSLTRIDPTTARTTGSVSVGAGPHSIAATEDAIWVANHNDDSIMRIDPTTLTVTASAATAIGPHQILSHGSDLWLVSDASCTIRRIDPASGAPIGEALSFGSVRRSISGRRERLWGVLGQRVEPCTDLSVSIAAADEGTLYVFERFAGTLRRIGAAPGAKPVSTRAEIGGFLVASGNLWGVDDLDLAGKVYRIDVASGKTLATIEAERVSGTPVIAGGLIWVARQRGNSVIRIDPSANAILGPPIPIDSPSGLVADATGVWVSGGGSVVHIPFEP